MANFFTLPREIRDQVYELVLCEGKPVELEDLALAKIIVGTGATSAQGGSVALL